VSAEPSSDSAAAITQRNIGGGQDKTLQKAKARQRLHSLTAPLYTPRLCKPYSGFDCNPSYILRKFNTAAHFANTAAAAAASAAAGGPARQYVTGVWALQ